MQADGSHAITCDGEVHPEYPWVPFTSLALYKTEDGDVYFAVTDYFARTPSVAPERGTRAQLR